MPGDGLEPWELKPGDTLDYHIVWDRELEQGSLDSSAWSTPTGLQIVSESVNESVATFLGKEYRPNTVASVVIRGDGAEIGAVLEVRNSVVTSRGIELTGTRYIEVVQLYRHERRALL